MSEDVGGQCADLVDPENLGVGFGISTLSSIEREIQLLPVWRRAILRYRCWSMSKGYTAHSENRASTYMRTVNVRLPFRANQSIFIQCNLEPHVFYGSHVNFPYFGIGTAFYYEL
jgi:hypothetical protein